MKQNTFLAKLEQFLKGETWLHFTTMFMITTFLTKIFKINIFHNVFIGFVIALSWELFWRFLRKTPINFKDIASTIIGAIAASLIFLI